MKKNLIEKIKIAGVEAIVGKTTIAEVGQGLNLENKKKKKI